MSLIGVIILTAGYELVRDASRRFEASSAEYMNKLPSKRPHLSVCGERQLGDFHHRERRAKIMFLKPMTMMYEDEAHYFGQGRAQERRKRNRS